MSSWYKGETSWIYWPKRRQAFKEDLRLNKRISRWRIFWHRRYPKKTYTTEREKYLKDEGKSYRWEEVKNMAINKQYSDKKRTF